MTMKNALTLRNLYFFICTVLLLLIGYKGIHIYQKIETMDQAERWYAEKKLVQAEDAYQKARNNRSLLYKEDLLAARLQELEPITSMKQSLSTLDYRLNEVGEAGDFSGFMNVYAELLDTESTMTGGKTPYASYYNEIAAHYGIPDDVKRIFLQFIGQFTDEADEHLDKQQYDDNSFKWNLLKIPDSFYGGEEQKNEKLLSLFQRYDESVMTRLAGGGQYTELLNWSHAMNSDYASRSLSAAWLKDKTDGLVHIMLQKDAERDRPADFISHALSYEDYLTRSKRENTNILNYIQHQIKQWTTSADSMVKAENYADAVALYEILSGYEDMTNKLQAAHLAWTIHDPVRLFHTAGMNGNFNFVSGGGNRFGGLAYAVGIAEDNTLYFAVMSKDETVQVFQNSDFPSEIAIQKVSIEESLSTQNNPVILVEGDLGDLVLYSAYEVRNSNLTKLFGFTAEGYQVQPDKSLLVINLEGASPEEMAIFERQGEQYGFTGYKLNYTDINIANIEQYPNEKVRFTVNVLKDGYGQALAERDGHYVFLNGVMNFPEGSVTLIGMFENDYQEVEIPGSQAPSAPDPIEPETNQVEEDTMDLGQTDGLDDPGATEEATPQGSEQDNSGNSNNYTAPQVLRVPQVYVFTIE